MVLEKGRDVKRKIKCGGGGGGLWMNKGRRTKLWELVVDGWVDSVWCVWCRMTARRSKCVESGFGGM